MAMFPARRTGRTLTLTDPSREFEDIYERMGQLMNAASADLAGVPADIPWSPAADLTETDDAYAVHVELPGVHKDQLKVQLTGRELEITGEIKEPANGRRHRSSRRAGQFEYRTIFPGDVKAAEVRAELADGILTVSVPKSEAARPSRINVTDRPESDG
jgi:HSP20 family protein